MYGMAVDGQGNLWYADDGLNAISMLNPNSNQGKSYSVPLGDSLNMLAIQSGMLWYTEQDLASVGRLDPLSAAYTEFTASVVSQTLNPSCITASSTSGTLTVESGVLSWTDASYPTLLNNGGWRIYQMPPDSVPWGITVLGTSYMVDQGRQVLSRFSTPQIYLPIALK
jgi:streptogramin lyase